MRHTPHFLLEDEHEIRRLIRENPWVTYVSTTSRGLVASHYPTLLDEEADELTVVTHFGRPDETLHELGDPTRELLLVVQGPHGYISSSWYGATDFVPTWNHVTAHLHGVPEILSAEENLRVLDRLVEHFEGGLPGGRSLSEDPEKAARIALGTIGLRIRITRVDARAKLSQNKPDDVRARIIAELRGDGPYASPGLAAEMERASSDAAAVAARAARDA